MASFNEFLTEQGRAQQLGLLAGLIVICSVGFGLLIWANQPKMEALFTGLTERDASEVLGQLEEMKVEYQISSDGSAILVDADIADETRIKLDGGGLAINGGDGFELFNDADYGMTDFVQKINYQRALQGELSRTIMALEEVRYARVHLVLPERGLFREPENSAKASITLVKQPGLFLGASQIAGIQQLVASAVDGMSPEAVTILDERGVVLSNGLSSNESEVRIGLSRKQEVEQYLTSKANRILTQVFGADGGVVKIDVSLNRDTVQMTREIWESPEDLGKEGLVASSSVQRKFTADGAEASQNTGKTLTSENEEFEYRINKTVEQVVKGEGAIERITVSVLIPADSSPETVTAVESLIASAVGLRTDRGDFIRVMPLSSATPAATLSGLTVGSEAILSKPNDHGAQSPGTTDGSPDQSVQPKFDLLPLLWLCGGALGTLLLTLMWPRAKNSRPLHLSDEEKVALLEEVRGWLEEGADPQPQGSGATDPI